MTVHTVVILPILLVVFAALLFKRNRTKPENVYLFLCVLNYGLSLWYAFWFNKIWAVPKQKFAFLAEFNFARFHFLLTACYIRELCTCFISHLAVGERMERACVRRSRCTANGVGAF